MVNVSDMSLRDWFAGQALPAVLNALHATGGASDELVAELFGNPELDVRNEQVAAALAYAIADEMMRVRERR